MDIQYTFRMTLDIINYLKEVYYIEATQVQFKDDFLTVKTE